MKLYFNFYKGSGKVWIARTNEDWGITSFVKGWREYDSKNSGTIEFELGDGKYIENFPNTHSSDMRRWIEVKDGEITVVKELVKNARPRTNRGI